MKLPKWISAKTGKKLSFEWTSGNAFPEDLSPYALVVHCGGCMLNAREMEHRAQVAVESGVPFTNYGMVIAKANGVLERSVDSLEISGF